MTPRLLGRSDDSAALRRAPLSRDGFRENDEERYARGFSLVAAAAAQCESRNPADGLSLSSADREKDVLRGFFACCCDPRGHGWPVGAPTAAQY